MSIFKEKVYCLISKWPYCLAPSESYQHLDSHHNVINVCWKRTISFLCLGFHGFLIDIYQCNTETWQQESTQQSCAKRRRNSSISTACREGYNCELKMIGKGFYRKWVKSSFEQFITTQTCVGSINGWKISQNAEILKFYFSTIPGNLRNQWRHRMATFRRRRP